VLKCQLADRKRDKRDRAGCRLYGTFAYFGYIVMGRTCFDHLTVELVLIHYYIVNKVLLNVN